MVKSTKMGHNFTLMTIVHDSITQFHFKKIHFLKALIIKILNDVSFVGFCRDQNFFIVLVMTSLGHHRSDFGRFLFVF